MHQFRSGGHTNYKHCNKIICGDVYNRVNLLMFDCTCVSLCASSRLIKQTSWEWVLWRLPKEQKKRREESTRLDRPLFFFLGGVGGWRRCILTPPPPFSLLERESGFKHDPRVTHTHHRHTPEWTHGLSLSCRASVFPACWYQDLFGSPGLSHSLSHTHTKTILINTCHKFITDADAAQYARSTTTTYDRPTKRSSERNRNL